METRHTPAPWKIGKTSRGQTSIDGDGWWSMAKIVTRMEGCKEPFGEGMANLHLIAAAPDLLNVVMMVAFDSGEDGYSLEELRDAAKAAFAKATDMPANAD